MTIVTNVFAIFFTISAFCTIFLVVKYFKYKRKVKKDFLNKEEKTKDEKSFDKEELRKIQILERKKKFLPLIIFSAVTLALLTILIVLGVIYYV